MRGNFLDVPTDCPQRDERLGWTGDIQVFSPTATFLFDAAGFLSSWLADLAAEQHAGRLGAVRHPRRARQPGAAAAAAGATPRRSCRGCSTSAPATSALLARQLPSMRAWVDRDRRAGRRGPACGPAASSSATGSTRPRRRTPPSDAKADPDVVATAHLARSAEVVALGRRRSSATLDIARPTTRDLADRVRGAFAREYVTAGGRVLSDAATVYALALAVGAAADRASSAGAPASGSPTSSARPASGSAPASSARR